MSVKKNDFLIPGNGYFSSQSTFSKSLSSADSPTLIPGITCPLHVVEYLFPQGELILTVFRNLPLKGQGYGVKNELFNLLGVPVSIEKTPKALYVLELSTRDPWLKYCGLVARQALYYATTCFLVSVPGFVCVDWLSKEKSGETETLSSNIPAILELDNLSPEDFSSDLLLSLTGTEFSNLKKLDKLLGTKYLDSAIVRTPICPLSASKNEVVL